MEEIITNRDAEATGRERRSLSIYKDSMDGIHARTDRMFAVLMVFQWLAGIAAALWISPRTWIGTTSQIHSHVWAAVFFGGVVASFPVFLAWKLPGRVLTRQSVAIAQMTFSALLIHLTGGRIESHFHIFGSLAFLAFYRDTRVLATATVLVITDHYARGVFWPESIFGTYVSSHWRWLEHAGWVVFEDTFLLVAIRRSLAEMRDAASRRANLETLNAEIESRVAARTEELTVATEDLRASKEQFSNAFEHAAIGMALVAPDGHWIKVNLSLCESLGYSPAELAGKTFQDITHPDDLEADLEHLHELLAGKIRTYQMEKRYVHKDGYVVWALLGVSLVRDAHGQPVHFISQIQDLTRRKEAEMELEIYHKELMEASRRAGMAEVATSVLHNVGNVLNSVSVSAEIVSGKIRNSRAGGLKNVAAMLKEHEADLPAFLAGDPRGRALPDYLVKLADHLLEPPRDVLEELASLRKNIGHIKEIVAMQQGFSKAGGVSELLSIDELIDDAIRINSAGFERHELQVTREFCEVSPLSTERHKVLQILVNLLGNAKHALEKNGAEKKLKVRLAAPDDDTVAISVIDNGIGIAPENLTRVFQYGFTTRKDGHGFGLHGGALAARELGGRLTVHSGGPGKGAEFTLELPRRNSVP